MTTTEDHDRFLSLKRALQAFQSARLNETYADLKADPQYAKIGRFFFEKLYAPEDFSVRDASMKRLQSVLEGRVYSGMVAAMHKVVELHELTERLDDRMVEQMIALDGGDDLDKDRYCKVYRSLDNDAERRHQIALSLKVTRTFHRLSHKWIVAISLKTVRTTAHLLGMGGILDFIFEGYDGFRAIKKIDYFVETVEAREIAWHESIMHGTTG